MLENLCNEKIFKTSFILKSEHFLWLQLQFKMKSWNYVLEFKCTQNIRFQNTRKVDIFLEWIEEIFKTQILEAKPTIVHIHLQQTGINFELNIMKTLSSRPFSLPSEIFCIKAVIVACLYVVFNSVSVCIYQWREQATKTALIQNISLGRHKIWMNKATKMCKMLFPDQKYWSVQNLFSSFSLLNVMKPVWWCVMEWTNVFCKMYRS